MEYCDQVNEMTLALARATRANDALSADPYVQTCPPLQRALQEQALMLAEMQFPMDEVQRSCQQPES